MSIKFRSKYNHGFTNRGCVHCAILKALYGFKEKTDHQAKDTQFFFQIFPSKQQRQKHHTYDI